MVSFYLTEVVWPADSFAEGRPLDFRLIAECASKAACEQLAEKRAKSHPENGFDSSRDAWWGKSAERIHYYYQTTKRPGRFWNGMKAGASGSPREMQSEDVEPDVSSTREQAGEGPDDKPVDRAERDLPPLTGD